LGETASDETPAVDDAFARQTSITMGPRGTGFPIWLVYQGTNREPHLHQVYSSMLVTYLYNRIESRILHCDPSGFHLFVQGDHLWHSGSITDRINPLTLQPTCFLVPRTVVTVKMNASYPDFVRPEGPMEKQLEELPDSDDECLNHSGETLQIEEAPRDTPARSRGSPSSAKVGDEELERLYRELTEIKAKILSRWTALFASNSNTQQGSSSVEEFPSTFGGRSQDVVPELPLSNVDIGPDPQSRRASSRQTIQRVPYVGGSGGGLAKKNHNPTRMIKPVHQRWYYDSVPVLTAHSAIPDLTATDDISVLVERVDNRMTVHEGSPEGSQPLDRMPEHGEPINGELTD
jgi:hypothetical protein